MRTREDNNELCECLLAIDWPDWGGCPTILFSSGSISVETMASIMGLCVDGWEYKCKMLYFPYFRLVSATFTKCWIRSNGHAYDIIILKYYTRYCSLVLCSDPCQNIYSIFLFRHNKRRMINTLYRSPLTSPFKMFVSVTCYQGLVKSVNSADKKNTTFYEVRSLLNKYIYSTKLMTCDG